MHTKANTIVLLSFIITFLIGSCAGPMGDTAGKNAWITWNKACKTASNEANPETWWTQAYPRKSEFIYLGIAAKDYEYANYTRTLRRGTTWSEFGSETAVLGLSGAGTVLTGGVTNVLHAASGTVTGVNSSFNKNILFDQSITTFIARMDSLREAKLDQIETKLKTKEHSYSYAEAMRDIEDYGHKGLLDSALGDIAKQPASTSSATPSATSTTDNTPATGATASSKKPTSPKPGKSASPE
jgi:hypothetical protein